MDVLDYREESVSVSMEEVKSSDWAKQAYVPDIKGTWDALYKKPVTQCEDRVVTRPKSENQQTWTPSPKERQRASTRPSAT